jgi:hypothetical protein
MGMRLRALSRKLGLLPYMALGPVTGPLAWRMVRCVQQGDRVLAGLYCVAIVALWVVMAETTGQALAALAR